MLNNSRPARVPREGCLRAIIAHRLARGLAFAATVGVHTLGAQRPAEPMAPSDPWTLDAQYLQLSSGAVARHATPSLGVVLSKSIGTSVGSNSIAWRAEAGWLRAVRQATTAQGATLGISADLGLPNEASAPSRLIIRPGIAVLAGWAEAQDSVALYPYLGAAAGAPGTQYSWFTTRGRTFGAGVSLGAEFRLSSAIGVSASIRQWSFSGDVVAPNRSVMLGGVGISVHPQALVRDARGWLHGSSVNTENTR
jgi:hypothetical protein